MSSAQPVENPPVNPPEEPAAKPAAAPTPEAPASDPAPEPPKPAAERGAWHEGLSEGFRSSPLFEQIRAKGSVTEALEALASEHANAQELIGRKGVILPKDATPAEKARFYRDLADSTGTKYPESPADYDFSGIEVPEGLPIDDTVALGMIHDMHARGASEDQIRGHIQDYLDRNAAALESQLSQIQAKQEEVAASYRQKWGAQHDENWRLAHQALVQRAGSEEAATEIMETRLADGTLLGSHPFLIDLMVDIARNRLELGVPPEREPAGGFADAPEVAKQKLAELTADPENQRALSDEMHPMHKAITQRKRQLYEMAYPNQRGERGERDRSV